MKYLLKYFNLIALFAFIMLALFILTQKSCSKKKDNSELDKRITSDSMSSSTKLDVKNLQIEINESRVAKYADITQIPNNQYVKGNIGFYYVIDLKDTISQTVLLFPAGEYSYKENDWKVVKSLDNVKATIWSGLLKNKNYKIFIEGQADKAGENSFSRRFIPNYVFDTVKYCPSFSSDNKQHILYDSAQRIKSLSEPLKNIDLPLLRASYLNQKLLAYGGIPKPIILEGNVAENIGENYRNGKIILFIDTINIKR